MGVYLSTPKTDKTSDDGENEKLRYRVSSMQGWRTSMEDVVFGSMLLYLTWTSPHLSLAFMMAMESSSQAVSKFCAKYLHQICGEYKDFGILRHGFLASSSEEADSIQNASLKQNGKSEASCSKTLAPHKSTAVGFDDRMLLHSEVERKSLPHPERPDRLRAIAASLATAGIFPGRCQPISAREITREELQMIHSHENIESVELTSQHVASYFTPDTYANKDSALAARLAAGLCADLASAIYSGRAKNGFALVRPPGHHAGVRQAMGFCLHNNAAIAGSAAQAAGAKKVLIVDWDVHHGNGTQEIFEQNKTVLYISLHRHEGGKFYPGTGAAHEVGSMGGEGYCVNVPWSCGGVGDHSHRIRQSSHDPRSKRLDPKRGTIANRSPTETPSGTSCLRSHQFFKSIPET
ncbi:hypothetical protein Lser_V15G05440 [Lactuca serriola]